ncbi:hypothetical protein BLAT2472_80025 [Burkholderia latens]
MRRSAKWPARGRRRRSRPARTRERGTRTRSQSPRTAAVRSTRSVVRTWRVVAWTWNAYVLPTMPDAERHPEAGSWPGSMLPGCGGARRANSGSGGARAGRADGVVGTRPASPCRGRRGGWPGGRATSIPDAGMNDEPDRQLRNLHLVPRENAVPEPVHVATLPVRRAGTMQRIIRRRPAGALYNNTRHDQETRPRWSQRTAFPRQLPRLPPSTPARSRHASTACRPPAASGSSSCC